MIYIRRCSRILNGLICKGIITIYLAYSWKSVPHTIYFKSEMQISQEEEVKFYSPMKTGSKKKKGEWMNHNISICVEIVLKILNEK